MSATRVRYLLKQWRLRSLALSRLEDPSKEKNPVKPAGPAPSRPPSETGPATPE